ncbi:protein asteroid homolog 1-like [Gadus morhua]|uniref:protein asteroid homolog 1-like n=1 Tax=Gadus morhua TaxID=8049 RepID=UPI0011B4ABF3|nr:protein asteroid homolog 1-like [Gadus morhua]
MGVKGLYSLLEGKQIYEGIHFRDSKLVVDGINLAHILYNKADLDQNHGGEYLAFQAEVQAFFKALAICQIKAKVVIDGGSGPSDIKLDQGMDLQRTRVKNIPDALKGEKMGFYALFTTTVFEETLNSMKVPLVRCFGEADGQLAALARDLYCPVLSGDTDLYIYNFRGGVLPLDQFQWDSVKPNGARSYISCKRYTMSRFCNLYKIDHQLLPVFAALAGNDYVNLRDVKWASYVPAGSPTMKFRTASLVGLLSWLGARTDRTTEDTLTAALALIPNISQQARTEMRTEVQNAMLEYRLPSSSLRRSFSEGTVPPLPPEIWSRVPEWVRVSLARGDLGANILDYDILVHRRKFLRIQVEGSDRQSSNLTSRPIRQVMYGLLLGQRGGEVEEWDRVGLELIGVKVQPLVQGAAQTLSLVSPPQVGLPTPLAG